MEREQIKLSGCMFSSSPHLTAMLPDITGEENCKLNKTDDMAGGQRKKYFKPLE